MFSLPRGARQRLYLPLALFCVMHLLLLGFDVTDPGAFLRGDRSEARFELLMRALHAGAPGLGALFLETGLPGDYLVFAPLHALGGAYLVIVVQILAGSLTLMACAGLALELGASVGAAAVAGLLFALMPGSLMDPHLLVTETFFTALFASGVWALVAAVRRKRSDLIWLGMAVFTAAAAVRPQAMPVGLIAGMVLSSRSQLRPHAWLAPMAFLLVFPGIWLLWRWQQTGEIGLGPSMFDIGTNLRIRADRMALIAKIQDWKPMSFDGSERMKPDDFIALCSHHPGALLKTLVSDFLNLVANPGANGLFGKYLHFFLPNEDAFYWKRLLDNRGVFGAIAELLHSGWRMVLSFAITALLHLVVLAGAMIGLRATLRERESQLAGLLTLLLFLTQAGVVFASGIVRWTHRAPLEPILAAFAGIGVMVFIDHLQSRRRVARR